MPTETKAQYLLHPSDPCHLDGYLDGCKRDLYEPNLCKLDLHELDLYELDLYELDLHKLDLYELDLHEPDLHRLRPNQTVSSPSVCGNCAEFLALERTPYKGNCLLHTVPISRWDRACSQYYQDEPFQSVQSVGSDDEF